MDIGLCIEMALTDLPFEDRFQAAADMGLKNVEMWFVRDLSYDGTPEHLAGLADKAGVKITNTVIGAPDGSIGGGLTNPDNRSQWLERADMTLQFNAAAGIPASIVCTGNIVDGMTTEQMWKSVIEGLKPTIELADKYNVTLLLEPLNDRCDHPDYFVTSSDEGGRICRELASPRMKMLFDCYHMQIMEGDLCTHIETNIDVIGHFHSAGVPGRNELFGGEVHYPRIIDHIESLGYAGTFGLEYAPKLPAAESLKKTLEYLS